MSSHARGLWWKEWRQLRLLRMGGALLIVVIPVILLSAAEASKRGWLPLGAIRNYSAATVVQDALPMVLGFVIWPLLALMLVGQSFCGDVASGTEWFWMARPVKPRRVWMTRLLASLLSLTGVIALHWVVWRLLVAAWGNPDAFDAVGQHTRWFLMNQFEATAAGAAMFAGLLVAIAAFLSALAASSVARTPMQVLPLGLILMALPLGLGQLLEAAIPMSAYGLRLGFVRPLPLFLVYLFVSYYAFCRGEPAGRGKLVRGLSVLGIGLVAVVTVVLPASFWFLHGAEAMALDASTVAPSPTGDRFLVHNKWQGSAWLFDTDSGEELLHLFGDVSNVDWNAEGDRLAVARINLALGFVLDVYDRDGTALVEDLACVRCDDVHWAGNRLAVSSFRDDAWGFDWIDPATGERTPMDVEPGAMPLELVGPTQDGMSYVARQTRVAGAAGSNASDKRPALLLYALDLDAEVTGAPISIEGIDHHYRVGDLAPDGSGMLLERLNESAVVVFASARSTELGFQSAWLHPNRPVWAERVGEDLMILVDEGGSVRELERFEGHGAVGLSSSPDGRHLLLVRDPNVSTPGGVQSLQHWLYDLEEDRWTELEQTKLKDKRGWPAKPAWIDNDTVLLRGAGVLALCEPAVPGSVRYIKR